MYREWMVFPTAWGWAALLRDHAGEGLYQTILPVPVALEEFITRHLDAGYAHRVTPPGQIAKIPIVLAFCSYFTGNIIHDWPGMKLNLEPMSTFSLQVLNEVQRIPYGQTTTYGEIAAAIGRQRGARAVGQVLARNPLPLIIPCHRVLARNGPGGFSAEMGVSRKLAMLRLEAIHSMT